MFKNKILVKATQSQTPSPSSFFLLPLSLSSSTTDPPALSVELEILSWKLSRRWRLACLAQPFEILVLYQRSQSDLVDRVVSEFVKFDPSIRIGVEEEVKSGSLIAKAFEIGLRCVMLDHKWTCIGDNTFVKSAFTTSEERANFYAVNVQVQSGASDEVIFLISPDTLRFSRHQNFQLSFWLLELAVMSFWSTDQFDQREKFISDLISFKNLDEFENKREVILESFNFSMACTTLPSLFEGYVIGVSKLLPEGESVNNLQDLWLIKHGLTLKSDHYVAVQFLYGGSTDKTWFPSSFVLQGSGLTPASRTIRVPQAIVAFQSFIRLLEVWDFFGGGSLIAKEHLLIGNGLGTFSWEKATYNLPQCIACTDFIRNDPLSALDFRTPKPDIGYSTENNMDRNQENSLLLTDSDSKDAPSTINEVQVGLNNMAVVKSILPDKGQTPLLVPLFTKIRRKTAPKSTAPIRSKGDEAQVKATQDNCQVTAKYQKNETVFASNPTEYLLKTQTFAGAAQADKHVKSTQRNTTSTSVRSVKSTKKNDSASDNKFTVSTRIVLQAEAPAKKGQNKKKNQEVGQEGSQTGKTTDKKETATERGVDAQEKYSVTSGSNCPDYIKADAPVKKIQSQKKNEESTEDQLTKVKAKAKTKQSLDKDEVTAKVLNCHKRGQLQSLTVADLKCFLSCKKAKVGGTKEELIRRATDFLH